MSLAIAGAILGGIGVLGGLFEDKPDPISIKYPGPSAIEQEVTKLQLQVARKLSKQISDPTIKQDIYKLLPETKMSAADRNAYTQEFAQIKQEMGVAALQQGEMALGQQLDDLVDRGAMSSEAAEKQKAQNKAAINAMANIWNKKADAARILMVRNQWTREQGQNLMAASSLADIDQGAKNLFNQVTGSALNYFNQRRQNVLGLQSAIANANTQMDIEASQTKQDFVMGTAMMAGQGYLGQRQRLANQEYLESMFGKTPPQSWGLWEEEA